MNKHFQLSRQAVIQDIFLKRHFADAQQVWEGVEGGGGGGGGDTLLAAT